MAGGAASDSGRLSKGGGQDGRGGGPFLGVGQLKKLLQAGSEGVASLRFYANYCGGRPFCRSYDNIEAFDMSQAAPRLLHRRVGGRDGAVFYLNIDEARGAQGAFPLGRGAALEHSRQAVEV